MVKVRPKGTLLVDNLLGGFYTNHTRKLTIENDLTFYLDTISGFGFLGLASAQAPDIAQMLYRLPIDPEIPGCLRTELDPAVRLVLEKEFYCDVLLK